MVTVAIISEYNPFHLGHEYQIKEIRREFGEDTAIIAIMSGNYTQRGDIAVADKFLRARLAVNSGVNLVLELPFPYSVSSAEFFATAGVHIADSLGVVDYLSFGSELGDIDELQKIAKRLASEEYKKALSYMTASEDGANLGYAALAERAYHKVYEEKIDTLLTPNNILALEYLKALHLTKSKIKPHTVKRIGGAYDDEKITDNSFPSAMAIRELLIKDDISAFDYIPNSAKNDFYSAYRTEFPTDAEKLSSAVISNLRLNLPVARGQIHDTDGGLYNRLQAKSLDADSIQSLVALSATKKFTTARIKRAVWYTLLGVTSSDVKTVPSYTQVLALDSFGSRVLKNLKGRAKISVITKPSRTELLTDTGLYQKELSDKADSLFQLTKPTHFSGRYSLLCTPFVKKDK